MSKQTINIGASPNDGTGTPLRTSFDYTNQNFTEIYTALGGGVALPGATTQVIFNDGGTNLAGDAGLVYNKTTDALTVAGLVTAGSATITGDLTVDTSTLKVDSTNNRVGIGTATPSQALHVSGTGTQTLLVESTTGNPVLSLLATGQDVGSILYDRSNNYMRFDVSGVTGALRIGITGDVTVGTGNVVMATSGKGIDFSATASGSGTMTSELLNDYEEGTWVPTVGGTWIVAPTGLAGTYTKVGRLVTIQATFTGAASKTATGGWIDGLPFNVITQGTGSVVDDLIRDKGNTLASSSTRIWLTEISFNTGTNYVSVAYYV